MMFPRMASELELGDRRSGGAPTGGHRRRKSFALQSCRANERGLGAIDIGLSPE
jgi:hypothetical protein